jgi:DNA replication and repair protein RecF
VRLEPGLVVVVGPNGAGKTSLLEAIHVGTQGYSPKTRREASAIRFGAPAARVCVNGAGADGTAFAAQVTISRTAVKEIVLNGSAVDSAESLRRLFPVLAFTPDRLAVVKGGPAVRRSYLDRVLTRAAPSLGSLPGEFAHGVAQRNAALRRVRAGLSSRATIKPWTEAVARLGAELDARRTSLVESLSPRFTSRGGDLGLEGPELAYVGSGISEEALEGRLEEDVDRGTTGLGPHLCDLTISADGRELRTYGSQGEQRLAVLSLILGEADLLAELRGDTPLLLLDDVLSELDGPRRAALVDGLPPGGQVVVTTTALRALPDGARQPTLVVEVDCGKAVAR